MRQVDDPQSCNLFKVQLTKPDVKPRLIKATNVIEKQLESFTAVHDTRGPWCFGGNVSGFVQLEEVTIKNNALKSQLLITECTAEYVSRPFFVSRYQHRQLVVSLRVKLAANSYLIRIILKVLFALCS